VNLPIFDVINETAMSPEIMLSSDEDYALSNMRTCRTSERGGQILCCSDCGSSKIVYNPCNQRGCPLCYKKNQIKWKNKRQKKLLPVSHYHLVFSIPQDFVITWLLHKRKVIESFFVCVGDAIKELGEEYGLLFGFVLAFHSHGKGMCYKPHVHCVLTAGGMNAHKKWIEIGSLQYTRLVIKLRRTFYQILMERISIEDLPDRRTLDDREWKVHPTMHRKTGKWIMEYLSHSISGVVINMHQDFIIDKNKGTIGFSEMHSGNRIETVLSTTTFTERYLNHIPPSSEVMIRYYGLYANLHADELEAIRKELVDLDTGEEEIEEEKIHTCPICQGQMFAVITFPPNELPLFIKYTYVHGPPEHGELIKKGIKNS
jgi:hypothetical protein